MHCFARARHRVDALRHAGDASRFDTPPCQGTTLGSLAGIMQVIRAFVSPMAFVFYVEHLAVSVPVLLLLVVFVFVDPAFVRIIGYIVSVVACVSA